jgi:hypothetical protein
MCNNRTISSVSQMKSEPERRKQMWFFEGLLPIMAVLTVFTVIALLGVMLIVAGMKRRKMEMDAYKAAIEKGQPLPDFKISSRSPIATLKAAMIWIAIGIGFGLMMIVEGDMTALALSSIPILIGIALIISYVIEKKAKEKEGIESVS